MNAEAILAELGVDLSDYSDEYVAGFVAGVHEERTRNRMLDYDQALARARQLLGQEVDVTIRVSGFAAHLDDEAVSLIGPGGGARRILFTDLRRGVEVLAIEPVIPSDEAASAAELPREEVKP